MPDPAVETKVPVRPESLRRAARIFRYLLPYRVRFAGAILTLLISTGIGLTFPYLTGLLLDASRWSFSERSRCRLFFHSSPPTGSMAAARVRSWICAARRLGG
jgi:hypothetical protein